MARLSVPSRPAPSNAFAAAEPVYADTLPAAGTLCGVLLRAGQAGARWSCETLPPLPDGYTLVDRRDLPADTRIDALRGCRVFAHELTEYVGEPLMMLVGPEERICRAWLERLCISYQELPAPHPQETAAEWERGQLPQGFETAERELEADFSLTLPEASAEPLTAEALCDNAGNLHVSVSTAEPVSVSSALRQVFSLRDGTLRLRALRPLGCFSRRDEAILLACCTAAAAKKLGSCVRCELWNDGFARAPSAQLHCRWAIREGHITALELDGSYSGPGAPADVLASAPLLYDIPACRFRLRRRCERALFSGTVSEAAFPANAVELVFSRTAAELGRSEGDLRLEQLLPGNAADSLTRMMRELLTLSGYKKKKRDYDRRQSGVLRRGISLAFSSLQDIRSLSFSYPVSLTLRKSWRDSVALSFSGAQPSRAAADSLCIFAAAALGIRREQVVLLQTGEALPALSESEAEQILQRGCEELLTIWRDGKEQELLLSSDSAALRQGWGVTVAEAEIDTATGGITLPGLWCSYHTGRGAGVSETARLEGGLALALPMTAPALTAAAHLRPQSALREDALPERSSSLLPAMGLAAACGAAVEQALRQSTDELPLTHPYLLSLLRQEDRI